MFRGISARTMAKVRGNVGATLTDSCTIQRETEGVGAMGEPLHEFEDMASEVACRLIRAGTKTAGTSNVEGGREATTDRYRLILAVGTVISADYRVVMSDGLEYEVVDVEASLTDAAFVAAILVRARGRNG